MKKNLIDQYIVSPIQDFIHKQTSAGFVLMGATLLALIVANSPWSEQYHAFWKQTFTIGFENYRLEKDLSHWINDGLMAIFFFVVGLELKREMLAGELAKPQEALLPIFAAIGGMVVPAAIFMYVNHGTATFNGWGIPMATDIAFALGILYLLGDRVPFALKIFLTALAIVDDLGAVLVVAFFYTSEISYENLGIGALFMVVLMVANWMGVRSNRFYGIIGIGGLWMAFLLSGLHATIAAVLAAFTIPANAKIDTSLFAEKAGILLNKLTGEIKEIQEKKYRVLSKEEIAIFDKVAFLSKDAHTPLQSLEHGLHPFVSFVVLPVFAFSNAGVTLSGDILSDLTSPLALGIILGLVIGKLVGITLFSKVVVLLKFTSLPKNVSWRHIYGVSLLAGVGFTMSLFITDLAFLDEAIINQAKVGILLASTLSGLLGYYILSTTPQINSSEKKVGNKKMG